MHHEVGGSYVRWGAWKYYYGGERFYPLGARGLGNIIMGEKYFTPRIKFLRTQ